MGRRDNHCVSKFHFIFVFFCASHYVFTEICLLWRFCASRVYIWNWVQVQLDRRENLSLSNYNVIAASYFCLMYNVFITILSYCYAAFLAATFEIKSVLRWASTIVIVRVSVTLCHHFASVPYIIYSLTFLGYDGFAYLAVVFGITLMSS